MDQYKSIHSFLGGLFGRSVILRFHRYAISFLVFFCIPGDLPGILVLCVRVNGVDVFLCQEIEFVKVVELMVRCIPFKDMCYLN